MNHITRSPHARVPRGGEPITNAVDALALLDMAVSLPLRPQTIVIPLDAQRRGRNIVVVDGTDDPDTLFGVVDMVVDIARVDPDAGGVIIATVRPGGGFDVDDLERWDEADEMCALAGLELVEWFVIGTAVSCPRAWRGVEDRWEA